MPAKHIPKSFVLRGYIEQVGKQDFFAICLTVNVCTRGTSMEEAEKNLSEAVSLYIDDAIEENAFSQWVPRRAPLYHYRRYAFLWIRTHLNSCLPPHDAQLTSRIVYA
ncbi:MAG: type II toxin-antitoxin system HicB family antitoxin [candidate division NC10 bacterium]